MITTKELLYINEEESTLFRLTEYRKGERVLSIVRVPVPAVELLELYHAGDALAALDRRLPELLAEPEPEEEEETYAEGTE